MTGRTLMIRAALIGIGIPPYALMACEPMLAEFGGTRPADAVLIFTMIFVQVLVWKLYFKIYKTIING